MSIALETSRDPPARLPSELMYELSTRGINVVSLSARVSLYSPSFEHRPIDLSTAWRRGEIRGSRDKRREEGGRLAAIKLRSEGSILLITTSRKSTLDQASFFPLDHSSSFSILSIRMYVCTCEPRNEIRHDGGKVSREGLLVQVSFFFEYVREEVFCLKRKVEYSLGCDSKEELACEIC